MVLMICLVMVWLEVTWLGDTGITIQNMVKLSETEVFGLVYIPESLVLTTCYCTA